MGAQPESRGRWPTPDRRSRREGGRVNGAGRLLPAKTRGHAQGEPVSRVAPRSPVLAIDQRYIAEMDWSQLDVWTRSAVVSAIVALFSFMIPPISVASAVVSVGFAAFAWQRSRSRGEPNRTARLLFLGGLAFIILIVAGNALYSANN
jgi:hypothetical protein